MRRRITAGVLCAVLCITSLWGMTPMTPERQVSAKENEASDVVPWNGSPMPALQPVADASVQQEVKFTHKEWTGEQGYEDVNGETVTIAIQKM